VQPRSRLHRAAVAGERAVVSEHVAHGVGGGGEQEQHAVAFIDFATAPLGQEVARQAIVTDPQRRHRRVAEGLPQTGAVDDVREKDGADLFHGRRVDGADIREESDRPTELVQVAASTALAGSSGLALSKMLISTAGIHPVTALVDGEVELPTIQGMTTSAWRSTPSGNQ